MKKDTESEGEERGMEDAGEWRKEERGGGREREMEE